MRAPASLLLLLLLLVAYAPRMRADRSPTRPPGAPPPAPEAHDAAAGAATGFPPPPPELRPPPRAEEPQLLLAGADRLTFRLAIHCRPPRCPDNVHWNYSIEGKDMWKTEFSSRIPSEGDFTTIKELINLQPNTTYVVRAKPITTVVNGNTFHNWFNKTPSAPFTVDVIGRTCSREVPAVQQLLVHSAGPRWLALSWLPPAPACLARLEYRVRHYPALLPGGDFRAAGGFLSDAPWAVGGRVAPCAAWPGRHCLLLVDNVDPHKDYLVDVQVLRPYDNSTSQNVTAEGFSNVSAPGAPEDLRCVRALRTALTLRWRCPLRPGGVLRTAHVRLRGVADGRDTRAQQEVGLRAEYSHTVADLQPGSAYEVAVWFSTTTGEEGRRAELTAWTAPTGRGAACAGGGAGAAGAAGALGGGAGPPGAPWAALLGCVLALGAVAVAAFFVGRRYGSRGMLLKSGFTEVCAVYGGEKGQTGAGDGAALCRAAGRPGAATPPSSLLEHAEAEAAPAGPPRASAHHYEELRGGARCVEAPYEVACDALAPPQPFYAEVRRPSPVPPQPQPPVYAQVDKRRPPAPPAPPPTAPRPAALQDSD